MKAGLAIWIFCAGLGCLGAQVQNPAPLDVAFVADTPASPGLPDPGTPHLAPAVRSGPLTPPPLRLVPQLPPDILTVGVLRAPPELSAVQQNAFSRVSLRPDVIKSTFAHENMVKMAQNFVPGHPLPDAPSYVPLTSQQKFDRFWRGTYSADTVLGAVFDSLISQASGAYSQFGGGMEGYGKRYGATLLGAEAGAFFGRYFYPRLLHQDPRYFPSHENAISDRMAYAASRVLITRSDDGRNVFNTSLILSQLTQAALANAYLPYRNETVSGTLENAAASLGSVAQAYLLNEFWPDIKSFLSQPHPRLPGSEHRSHSKPPKN